ncbi:hypothetical protein GCM10026983_32220 [Gracilibacillus alcaliphilus]
MLLIREQWTRTGCVDFCVTHTIWVILVEVPLPPTQKFAASSFLSDFLNNLLDKDIYHQPDQYKADDHG